MKRIILVLLCVVSVLTLAGCSNDNSMQLSGATQTLEILLTDTDVLCLDIPIELVIAKRDNQHYWEFNNGVSIYRMTSTTSSAKYDAEHDLYVGNSSVIRNFDSCCVMVNCTGNVKEYFLSALSKATVKKKDALAYKELGMKYLPAYNTMSDMELVDNMYMPPNCEDVLYDIYNSKLYTQGTDWLQSIIIDAKLDDLRPRLLTLATLNAGVDRVTGWYESDDMFYCYTDKTVLGAKKLAYNSWYVYYGSSNMKDYVLTGINTVHAN